LHHKVSLPCSASTKADPCPLYVLAKDSYMLIFANFGSSPNKSRAALLILAAPAVCELEGPIITGPIISNTELNFIISPLYPYHIIFKVARSEEHTSELQSRFDLVCRLLLEKK